MRKQSPRDYAGSMLNSKITQTALCDKCVFNCPIGVCTQQILNAKFYCRSILDERIKEFKSGLSKNTQWSKDEISFFEAVKKQIGEI